MTSIRQAPRTAVADASIKIAKKADVIRRRQGTDILEIVADAPLFSATNELVDVGDRQEGDRCRSPTTTTTTRSSARRPTGRGRREAGKVRDLDRELVHVTVSGLRRPVLGRPAGTGSEPFLPWFPKSIDPPPDGFAALSKTAAVPFVVTTRPRWLMRPSRRRQATCSLARRSVRTSARASSPTAGCSPSWTAS